MPWLYSGPEDRVCKLRGCSDGEEDEDDEDGGRRVHEYWDGSRDVWVTHVAERVDPDAVFLSPPQRKSCARSLMRGMIVSPPSDNVDC